jgi:ketosteroid isomerase-like protein
VNRGNLFASIQHVAEIISLASLAGRCDVCAIERTQGEVMQQDNVPDLCSETAADLFQLHAEANEALINGRVDGYLELISHAADYTLMNPFGGAPSRGFVNTPERRAAMARFFKAGTSTIEPVASYASGDLVVLVMIERQRAAVGGLGEQDWSLRVTQVYRRAREGWEVVHRHADGLANGISVEQAAALARG